MSGAPEPLDRQVLEAQRLMEEHPPVWRHPNKRLVYELACPPGCTHRGQLVYTPWREMPLPEVVNAAAAAALTAGREDVYDYVPTLRATETRWNGTSTSQIPICSSRTDRLCSLRTRCRWRSIRRWGHSRKPWTPRATTPSRWRMVV